MFLEFVNLNIWWFAGLALVLNLLLMTVLQANVKGAPFVSALEMPQLQRAGKSVIIDVNETKQFEQSHIPNAISAPLKDINEQNRALLKHKDKTAVIVCQTGSRSASAAKQLISLGFSDLHILRGGLTAWTKENLPVNSTTKS